MLLIIMNWEISMGQLTVEEEVFAKEKCGH